VSPLEIEREWSEEFYWLMLSRWLDRKKTEEKAAKEARAKAAGKPKGGIIPTPEGGRETTTGIRVGVIDGDKLKARLSTDYNPTRVARN
jgi:hypothetical protein